ncbi:MAG: hypothetical protein WKF37_19065 [Bryobacteraceae bacterium]
MSSELPVEMHGFQVQQSRWSKGLTQVAIKLLPTILQIEVATSRQAGSNLSSHPEHLLPFDDRRFRPDVAGHDRALLHGLDAMVFIDLPLIVASFWSISAFYLMAHRELYPNTWKRGIFLLPALMAAGVAFTISNTRAVLEACFGVQTSFVRTPKYAIQGDKLKLANAKYRSRSGWLPYAELAFGSYFLYMISFAIDTSNFFAIPFLLIFVSGYYWAGFSTLWTEYQGRVRWHRQRRLELQKAAGSV